MATANRHRKVALSRFIALFRVCWLISRKSHNNAIRFGGCQVGGAKNLAGECLGSGASVPRYRMAINCHIGISLCLL